MSFVSKAYGLLAATVTGCIACSSAPKPTVEHVSGRPEQYRGPEYFNLTVAQQRHFERRALAGDIMAAKRLVMYHMGVTGDDEQCRRWLAVVERLQKQRRANSK